MTIRSARDAEKKRPIKPRMEHSGVVRPTIGAKHLPTESYQDPRYVNRNRPLITWLAAITGPDSFAVKFVAWIGRLHVNELIMNRRRKMDKTVDRDPNYVWKHRHKAEPGECLYCDRERAAGNHFHPPHDASPRCESGKHSHCSCDTCF